MAKVLSFAEFTKHNSRTDCWLLIDGKIYDMTPFLEEHPGGDEVLLAATEKDATDDFDDVGHSNDAKELMKKYFIGEVDENTVPARKKYNPPSIEARKARHNESVIKLLQLGLTPASLGISIWFAIPFLKTTSLFLLKTYKHQQHVHSASLSGDFLTIIGKLLFKSHAHCCFCLVILSSIAKDVRI
ncbi:cytochrome b5 isoform A-like isoform X1 [Tripterygium wilfordii]|uniref:Cytochrome b5 isoform A-like isoform X1 n=1 Tax=Tripterygium wilfordii TaxID=458696 RepID=A0A7J7CE36_TRIWF|nr:cytochrome b5 isoform A-like isoform X1 [Tripterygium wilfordii]